MIVLAIDTAANSCAACLYDAESDQVLASIADDIGRGHAEHLLGTIDKVLAAADLTFEEIGKIAVSIGPGSFTGIRVGVATARSLGLALEKQVVGVSTLEAIAADYHADQQFAVAIQAGRGQAYVQGFDVGAAALDMPYVVKLDDHPSSKIDPIFVVLIGNAAQLVDDNRTIALLDQATGSIASIAKLGASSSTPPNPLYVRAADAKKASGFALPRQAEVAK
ncbi:MAG: tRNA (adenosine(37)-N6)-threonylcarbamoyltransferase complex dimerization subunit type 1 TsaB [Pseudomonadota bacterium]